MTTTRPTLPKLLANKSADELRKLLIDLAKSSKDTREAIFEYYGQYQSPEEFESTFKKQSKQNFYTYSRMMDEYYADSAKAKKTLRKYSRHQLYSPLVKILVAEHLGVVLTNDTEYDFEELLDVFMDCCWGIYQLALAEKIPDVLLPRFWQFIDTVNTQHIYEQYEDYRVLFREIKKGAILDN